MDVGREVGWGSKEVASAAKATFHWAAGTARLEAAPFQSRSEVIRPSRSEIITQNRIEVAQALAAPAACATDSPAAGKRRTNSAPPAGLFWQVIWPPCS